MPAKNTLNTLIMSGAVIETSHSKPISYIWTLLTGTISKTHF